MTLAEMAEYLKVSQKTIVRMVHAGKLPGAKVASQWRFVRAAIDDWLNTRMQNMFQRTRVARSGAQRGRDAGETRPRPGNG